MRYARLSRIFGLLFCILTCSSAFLPPGWNILEKDEVDGEQEHLIIVALKQSNVELLPSLVREVSDPDSPKYGQYYTNEQVTKVVAPSDGVIDEVASWLKDEAKATSIELVENRDVIYAWAPLKGIRKAFQTDMRMLIHSSGRRLIRSTTGYVIPQELGAHIDLVHGISDFPYIREENQPPLVHTRRTRSTNAPIIVGALSRGKVGSLTVQFVAVCQDGSVANTIPPCKGDLESVKYTVENYTDTYQVNLRGYATPTCQLNSEKQTQCSCTIAAPHYYPLKVSIEQSYRGGKISHSDTWQFPVVVVPPVIPQTILAQYGVPPNTVVTNPNATQAVAEFEQQYYSPSDLEYFFNEMGIISTTPVTVIGWSHDSPNDKENPGLEANLDIQYIMGVAPGAPTTFWSVKANSTVEIDHILTWAYQVANTTNPPLVNSLSYGMTEDNVDKFLGAGYLERSDAEFMKLALRGLTIIIADGDTGAGDLGPPPMSFPTCHKLHADWPSQSPYVTAISSTYFTPFAEPICYEPQRNGGINCIYSPIGEVSVSLDDGILFTSGGGFSNFTKRADFQKESIARYVSNASKALPPSSFFNIEGRAYPDATAVGHNLMVAYKGSFVPVDGTSASAPIFAAIITLLNNDLLNNNQPPLGYLNPMIYKLASEHPNAFYDVTRGNNRCGALGFSPLCCEYGYKAAQGWDAASGLGSPNYAVLRELLLGKKV